MLWHCDDFCFPEVVPDWGCHSTEFRLTCRELEQQIVILDAFFADSSNCTSAIGGAGTKPSTTPSFLMADENETSTVLTRDIREAVIAENKHIRQPVKHRYVADWSTPTGATKS
jgi:N-acetyl-gamma-glutamylphosphate reductase